MEIKKGKKPNQRADGVPDKTADTWLKTVPDTRLWIGILVLAVLVLGAAIFFGNPLRGTSQSAAAVPGSLTVWYFYGTGCVHCEDVTPYVQSLQKKYPDVEFRILEIYDHPANRDTLIAMNQKLSQTKTGVPVAFVGTTVLLGDEDILRQLENVIISQRKSP
jgi:thiol-disulfide isomerase/thioredoxin